MNRHAPSLLRHLRSILAGPVTVTLVIPALILTLSGGHRLAITGPLAWAAAVLGLLLALAGLALLIWTIVLFDRVGHGTLSPLNPTQALVLVGPYRHVRNPMFTGVLAILGGESLITASPLLLAWFVLFWTALAIAIPRVEEPRLAARFGPDYTRYRQHVPRWIPRARPWTAPRPER
jgi:protein-S-isoprenylcysteine O-methyltransferase Ste14